MLRLFDLFILSSVLPVLLVGQPRQDRQDNSIAFIHATIIDATGADAQPDMTLVITHSRIATIGKTSGTILPKDVQVIDASHKFLIPGLWDMHIHSGGYENGKKYFPVLIAHGITGVRDMGSPLGEILRLRNEVREEKILGPHMVIAGPLLQGPLPFQMSILISVANEAEASRAVISLKNGGVDFIKLQDAVPRNIYFAIASEAKRQGLPFAGHVPPFITAMEATNAGQRSIEHLGGRFQAVLLACSNHEIELTEKVRAIVRNVLKSMAEKKEADDSEIFHATFMRPLIEDYSDQKAAALFSAFHRNDTWQVPTLVAQPIRNAINNGRKDLNEEDVRYGQMLMQKQLDVVGTMKKVGVGLMAGTDLPPDNPQLHEELLLLVKAGLTPLEALQAATRNPAKFLGRLDSLGTIEKGKIADLVLLDANPLEDIRNTRKISAVVLSGKYFDRAELDTLIAIAR
jgi:imidazolonepropionase-like amidohydrolase